MKRNSGARLCRAAVSMMISAMLAQAAAGEGLRFFVSPEGDDANPGTEAAPFATLERARDAVRAAIPDASGDIEVAVRAGVYRLERTLELDARDSGREGAAVIWRSVDGLGAARILGSAPLTGWQPHEGRIWKLPLPGTTELHTLYEDGARLFKARWPSRRFDPAFPAAAGPYRVSVDGSPLRPRGTEGPSWLTVASRDARRLADSVFRPGPDGAGPAPGSQLKIQVFPWGPCDWHRWTCRVTAVDPDRRRIAFDTMGDGTQILGGARYFLEDDPLFLDAPGEFFFDETERVLYAIPRGDGHPDTLGIAAPSLLTLVRIEGESRDRSVRHVRFEGLSFEETGAISPAIHWWTFDGTYRWGREDHGLVRLSNAEAIEIRDCRFLNSGRHGILMVGHNVGNTVRGCLVEGMGISGITLSNRFPNTEDRCEDNELTDNRVGRVGELGLYASCIEVMNASGNLVSHSDLYDSPRYAVTLRGNTDGTQDPNEAAWNPATPPARGNRFHHLRIWNCGQDSGDMGAVHAAGVNLAGGDCVNTFEQITIVDTAAIEGMNDWPPDGIFLDWPIRTMHQVFRHVQVIRVQGMPFRSNRPENETSAVFENVSWRPGFSEERMEYDRIGVTADFPEAYGGGRRPPVTPPAPVGLSAAAEEPGTVTLRWAPADRPRALPAWLSWLMPAPAGPSFSETPQYFVFRDGVMIGTTFDTRFTDTSAGEGTSPRYSVAARDGDFGPMGPLSIPVAVRVPPDLRPPEPRFAGASGDLRSVLVIFSKPVDSRTTTSTANYTIMPPARIRSAAPGRRPTDVLLDVEGLIPDRRYTLTVRGVRDRTTAGNVMRAASPVAFRTDGLALYEPFDNPVSIFELKGNAAIVPCPSGAGPVLRLDGRRGWAEGPADLALGSGDFTLSAWIRKERGSSRVVLSQGDGFGSPHQWTWGWEYPPGANNIAFRTDNRYFTSAEGSLPLFEWVHIAFVRRGGEGMAYVGGEPSGERHDLSGIGDLSGGPPLRVGRRNYERSPAWFGGSIAQVRVYSRALSGEEIRRLAEDPRFDEDEDL